MKIATLKIKSTLFSGSIELEVEPADVKAFTTALLKEDIASFESDADLVQEVLEKVPTLIETIAPVMVRVYSEIADKANGLLKSDEFMDNVRNLIVKVKDTQDTFEEVIASPEDEAVEATKRGWRSCRRPIR